MLFETDCSDSVKNPEQKTQGLERLENFMVTAMRASSLYPNRHGLKATAQLDRKLDFGCERTEE